MILRLFRLPKAKIPIGIRLKRVLAMDRHDGRMGRLVKLTSYAASTGYEKSPSCTGASRKTTF
ncbi:MAG: hypothetical protein IJU98_11010 [Synergistaceae bacterium]|nr:hypothetical protein [Synergistaceae bacterium]